MRCEGTVVGRLQKVAQVEEAPLEDEGVAAVGPAHDAEGLHHQVPPAAVGHGLEALQLLDQPPAVRVHLEGHGPAPGVAPEAHATFRRGRPLARERVHVPGGARERRQRGLDLACGDSGEANGEAAKETRRT